MPGLIGKYSNKIDKIQFSEALNFLIYDESYVCDSVYTDDNIIASRVHLNIVGENQSPFSYNDIFVWVDGEVYNFDEINSNCNSFPEFLSKEYLCNNLNNAISKIDGYFSAVIYDKFNGKILLITDRYGLKPIYYSFSENCFTWASEVKVFKKLLNKVTICDKAITVFSKIGYLTGDFTLFNEIKLLNAATILTYETTKQQHTIQRYWKWSNIKQRKITLSEATELLYLKLKEAVEKRLTNKKKIGMTLSGGIDSRVLLSLLPDNTYPTVTWGIKHSIDRILAKKVINKNKNIAYFFESDINTWFENRIHSIWKTDGMFNVMHMHSASYHKKMKEIFDINLNGFAGDLNIGGGWIINKNKRITEESAFAKIKEGTFLVDINDDFYNTNHEDPFYIDTRVRRFTIGGSVEMSKLIEQRKPFFDNSVMEFIYSLPDEFREGGCLYYEMIRKYIPKLFEKIHTTHGISNIAGQLTLLDIFKRKFSNLLIKANLKKEPTWRYSDYENWIRDSKFELFIKNTLLDSTAIILTYIGKDYIEKIISSHLSQEQNNSETILAILTLEIWFQQFYNDKYVAETDPFKIHF